MVSSKVRTVDQYLAELPDNRRADVETMRWGMITYEVPLDT